jgi:hypothetical protein
VTAIAAITSVLLLQCSSVPPSPSSTGGSSGASGTSGTGGGAGTSGDGAGTGGSIIDIEGGASGSTGGCADAGSGAGTGGASSLTGCESISGLAHYQHDVFPILQGCTGEICHSPPTRNTLVNVVSTQCCDGRILVSPDDSHHSYLIDKVLGRNLCAGSIMPAEGHPLSEADVLTLQRWICGGALDD